MFFNIRDMNTTWEFAQFGVSPGFVGMKIGKGATASVQIAIASGVLCRSKSPLVPRKHFSTRARF
jgi:hypothetical protein